MTRKKTLIIIIVKAISLLLHSESKSGFSFYLKKFLLVEKKKMFYRQKTSIRRWERKKRFENISFYNNSNVQIQNSNLCIFTAEKGPSEHAGQIVRYTRVMQSMRNAVCARRIQKPPRVSAAVNKYVTRVSCWRILIWYFTYTPTTVATVV